MKMKKVIMTLFCSACVFLSGCYLSDYKSLKMEVAQLEAEYSQLEQENFDLALQKNSLTREIEETTLENRELYESTLKPYQQFNIKGEEYVNLIKKINKNPDMIWYNYDEMELLDDLIFEKTINDYENTYVCEIYNFTETGERCVAEISTLETDIVTKVVFTYHYPDSGEPSDLGYTQYFNYSDVFVSAFIFLDQGETETTDDFPYYFERFFNYGLYYEGNAWVHNYISADGKTVTFEILPIGLKN